MTFEVIKNRIVYESYKDPVKSIGAIVSSIYEHEAFDVTHNGKMFLVKLKGNSYGNINIPQVKCYERRLQNREKMKKFDFPTHSSHYEKVIRKYYANIFFNGRCQDDLEYFIGLLYC